MDDKNILIDRGKFSFLATIFSGRSGKRLSLKSDKGLKMLENKYKKSFKDWDGDMAQFKGAKRVLLPILSPAPLKNSANKT